MYKEWADGIKHNQLNSLKSTVARLLLDFEQDESVNNMVNNLALLEKDSKKQALTRILSHMEGVKPKDKQKKQLKKKTENKKHDRLYDGWRDPTDIKRDFIQLIDNDLELS